MISVQSFDDLIAQKSLLTHYFYEKKWNQGELTLEELQVYAKEYFHLAKAVPGIVSRVRDRAVAREPELLQHIDENIKEETEHIELWKRFGKSLGVSEQEMEAYEASDTTKNAVKQLEDLAEESFESGVAAMYAMEREIPMIAKTKKVGLCDFYNLTSEDAHVYFDEHLNEENHYTVWQKVEMDHDLAQDAIERSLAAQHQVLDGVCEMAGICVEC